MFDSTKRSCFERGFAPSEGVVETVILGKVSSNPCCNTAMINSQPNGLVCHSSKVGPPRCLIPLDSRGHSFGGCESLFFHWKDSPLNGPTLKLHPSEPLQAPIKKNPTQKTTTSKQPGPHARHHKLASSPPHFCPISTLMMAMSQVQDLQRWQLQIQWFLWPRQMAMAQVQDLQRLRASKPAISHGFFPWKFPSGKWGPPNLGMRPKKNMPKASM